MDEKLRELYGVHKMSESTRKQVEKYFDRAMRCYVKNDKFGWARELDFFLRSVTEDTDIPINIAEELAKKTKLICEMKKPVWESVLLHERYYPEKRKEVNEEMGQGLKSPEQVKKQVVYFDPDKPEYEGKPLTPELIKKLKKLGMEFIPRQKELGRKKM